MNCKFCNQSMLYVGDNVGYEVYWCPNCGSNFEQESGKEDTWRESKMYREHMNIKQKLQAGQTVYGTWCLIPSPEVINIIAKSGLDFVFIDMEHGATDFVNVGRMITSAQVEGCSAIVRVPKLQEDYILRVLDLAPDGIVVPHIETKYDAVHFVHYSKFAPIGYRGYSPYTKSGGYNYNCNYTKNENNRLLNIAIVEGSDGIANLEDIVKIKDIDVIYLGTYDISVMLGIPGQVNDKRVYKVLEDCTKFVKNSDKIVGCMFHNKEEHDYFVSLGIQMLAYSVDTNIIYKGYSELKNMKNIKQDILS